MKKEKVIINVIKYDNDYDVIIVDESGSFCFKFDQEKLDVLADLCNRYKSKKIKT